MKRVLNIIKSPKLILFLVLLLGLAVRLYKIDNPIADWHSWRQADTASVSHIYAVEGIDVLHPRYFDISSIQTGIFNPEGFRFVEFPIYNVLNAALAKKWPIKLPRQIVAKTWLDIGFVPNSVELWGRFLSIFSSLASMAFLYLIGKNLYNRKIGLLSALFFGLIPYNIFFSRVILPEPMAIAFALGGIYGFVRFVKKDSVFWLYLSASLFAVSLLIKPFSAFYLLAVVYLAIRKFGFREFYKNSYLVIRHLLFFMIIIIPFFAWRIFINHYPIGIPFFEWAFNGDGIRFKPAFWRWLFAERVGNLILGVWGVIPLSFALLTKSLVKYGYFIHMMLLAAVAYLTVFATANVRHDYYQAFIIPALSMGMALGVYYMWTNTNYPKITSRALLLFSMFIMFITGWIQVKEYFNVNNPAIVQAGIEVDKLIPKDAMVIAPYSGDTAFLYQLHRYGWPVVDTDFDTLISRGAQYFVAVNFADPDIKLLEAKYKAITKTDKYIVIDLTKLK